jgi:hypothetical protein
MPEQGAVVVQQLLAWLYVVVAVVQLDENVTHEFGTLIA